MKKSNIFLVAFAALALIAVANAQTVNRVVDQIIATACTNQFVRSLAASGAATCATIASADISGSFTGITGTGALAAGSATAGFTVALNSVTLAGAGTFPDGQIFGVGTGVQQVNVAGANSGAGAGARINFKNGATTIGAIGNNSSITGGAYDANLTVSATNALILFSSGTQSCTLGIKTDANGLTSCVTSSARFKDAIVALPDTQATFAKFSPRQFTRNDEAGALRVGLIAEEVEQIDKRLVFYDKDGKPLGVDYYGVLTELIAVVQKQQARIETLERR